MNQSDSNAIAPPNENVVNRIVEIFDVEDFNGFLELANQKEEPEQLIQLIDEPEDIELFSDSFDKPDFVNFVLDLVEVDGTDVSAEKTGTITDRPGKISGTKWNDINGDGIKNNNEPGLAGWTIYLDENKNGHLDDGETSVVTDGEGNYSFKDLTVPKTYLVAEVPQDSDLITPIVKSDRSNNQADSQPSRFNGIPNDPLFKDQWHLLNTGQTDGYPGVDVNVLTAWEKATGKDVTIGIVDDGLQSNHPDLKHKYQPELSYDFVDDDPNPSPDLNAEFPASHGTAVAGVAAASTNNNTGVAGVAPDANLAGLRLLSYNDDEALSVEERERIFDLNVAEALSYQNQEIDIYNNSWSDTRFKGLSTETLAALQDGVRNGRGGLGNIFVFNSANDRPLDNVNYNAYANSRYTIAVGAIDHRDNLAFYSTPGAAVLVSAYSENIPGNAADPAITTTDLTGKNGYNPEGDYTDSFNGTSAAAPMVSGVVALMLDTNPHLTWRDVQHILVETSAQNDPSDHSWAVNGAGHEISHKYGFGAVDANAAVNAAQSWTTVEPEVVTTSEHLNLDQAIPDNNAEGVSSTVGITEDVEIEWIEVVFDAEHTQRGDLEVTLTSPDGTESILAETHRDVNDNYDSWVFTSARHWDESSIGDWTLEVADNTTDETGTWNSWQLNIYGTDADDSDITGAQQVTVGYGDVDNVNFGARVADEYLVGSDQSDYFILSNKETFAIADFTPGEDLLELPEGIDFDRLEITQGKANNADDTIITFDSEAIAILDNINVDEITQSDFV